MKKFLFTLAALMMAGSAFAADVVVANVDFTEDQIGKQQLLPLSIVLDNEYVNGWEMTITYPEGVTAGNPKKNTAVLNQMVPNADGDEEMVTPLGDATANRIVQAYGTAGYWDPDDDGTFESYGAVKIGPTGTFKLYDLRVTPSADFKGGDIVIDWLIHGGFDKRNNQTGVGNSGTLTVHLTVPQAPAQPAPAPTITANGNVVTAAVEGDDANHTVELYIVTTNDEGEEVLTKVNNPYTVEQTFSEQKITFKALTKANEGESGDTWSEPKEITIPAKADAKAPAPKFREADGKVYAESAEGLEVVMMLNGEVCDNPYELPASTYEEQVFNFTAYAVADGKNYNINSDNATYTATVGANEKKAVESPSIQDMKHEGSKKLYDIVITPDPATDGTLQYSVNPEGTVLRAGATTIQYERKAEAYPVHVEAWTNEGATCKASEREIKDITVPALDQVAKPTIYWAPNDDGTFDIWVSCDTEDAVITLTDGTTTYTVAPGEHKTITYDIYDGYEATWNATAKATDMLDNTADPKEIIIDEETKYYQTPAPVIGEPVVTAENVTFTVTGEGTVTVTVTTSEGTKTYTSEEGSVTVVLPRGEEYDLAIVNATAKANVVPDGFDAVAPGRVGPKDIDIPALEYSAKPVINQTPGKSEWDEEGNQTVDGHVVTVTFEAVQGAEVYYRIDGKGEFVKWDGTPIYFRDNGDYTIEAYAVEPGKMPSEVVPQSIHVTEATSVNGLVNGKTVAGVRYFNMAGQEMQEANGVTIVVTTYTDGTTSAVKVIK